MLRNPEELVKISNELADVIIYCLGFSEILGIDVSNAVQIKLQKNAVKYPVLKRSQVRGTIGERFSKKGVPTLHVLLSEIEYLTNVVC